MGDELLQLLSSSAGLLWSAVRTASPVLPLLAWASFWFWAVDWVRLRNVLRDGGWVVFAVLWAIATAAAVAAGVGSGLSIGPLSVSPGVRVTTWSAGLLAIALLCGSARLSSTDLPDAADRP